MTPFYRTEQSIKDARLGKSESGSQISIGSYDFDPMINEATNHPRLAIL